MNTYSDTGNAKSNQTEYTVTEISSSLKKTVEERFGYVRIRGEITGFRGPHSSGHCYFALKDDRARIEAVIWKGVANKLKHFPQEGLEVIASGKLTTYPGSSKYQVVIDNLEPAGAGALMALLQERKKKLEAEGLFAPERKQLLPYMPKKIGVITSPTGAVIRDVLHRISDRFPLHVIVWPVRVQGETTGIEVSNAINGFNAMEEKPDLIIVARGGGSIEDLWGFNDEIVVRAAASSDIPLISAVGHETDWTLIDLAADIRAPTPTGAAELAIPVKAELDATIASYKARLQSALTRQFEKARSQLLAAERGLASPDMLLAMPRRRLDEATGRLGRGLDMATRRKRTNYESIAGRLSHRGLSSSIARSHDRLDALGRRASAAYLNKMQSTNRHVLELSRRKLNAFENQITQTKARYEQAHRLLGSLSYKSILDRGYAVVRNAKDIPVASIKKIKSGDAFNIELKDGRISAVAAGGDTKSMVPKKVSKKPDEPTSQGDLF